MWLATADNLVSINLKTADVASFPEVNGYGGARAVAVKDNIVAVGTPDGLLLIYQGNKQHHYMYTVNDGLASNNVKDLVFDGDYIWVGTDEGLTRFWYKNPSLGN